jgi:hypothetical protein
MSEPGHQPILPTGAKSALMDIKLQGMGGLANRAIPEEKLGTSP